MLAGTRNTGKKSRFGPRVWLICSLVLLVAAIVAASTKGLQAEKSSAVVKKSAVVQTPPKQAASAAAASGATYVGADTCTVCHAEKAKSYANSPHSQGADPRTPAAAKGCETCHGPGSKHIADPVNVKPAQFSKMKSDDVNAVCTTCHNKGVHANWETSTHASRGLSCTTCHSVHDAKSEKSHLKNTTQIDLCGTCHRDKVLKLQKSGHMPVREGKLECTSCHNPHGSTNVKMLKVGDTVSEACTSCHAEKRGPYLWEHAPVREGCTTCHDAHGSSNERMLTAKLPMLCQRCHISSRHPPTIYHQTQINSNSNRLLSRACVNCHAAIHGSNHPAGQFFLR